ncbi:aspartyl protease family protein [Brevundimonas faecalis]|uniref:Aspartyl protease n=1 Tax=Brevundimonas faecalis TaxID=947378 RepID=A0ABV2R805_9CAUL
MPRSRRRAVAALSFALACGVAPFAAAQAPVAPTIPTFPLFSTHNRSIVVARFGDAVPVPLVFDTGTNGNIVDIAYAEQIGLPEVGPSKSVDGATGRPIPGFTTRITGLKIAGVAIEDGPATVIDYKARDSVGIIGPNSFPGRLTEIDFAHGRIRILPDTAENRPSTPPVPHLDDLPAVMVALPGVEIPALVDTGNDSPLTLPLSMAERLPLKAPPVRFGTTYSAGGQQAAYQAQVLGEVRIGSVVLQSPMVVFNEGGHPNVGMPVLKQMRVLVDHTGQGTWLEPLED